MPDAVRTAHDSFQSPLIVQYVDGHDWVVYEQFTYCSPTVCVHIPKGFSTDFASIPRFLWRLLSPFDADIGKPAVVHDYLYRTPTIQVTREQADNELRAAMATVTSEETNWYRKTRNAIRREWVFKAVRTFGGSSFVPRGSEFLPRSTV
jgi:hypothetical protein